MAKGRPPRILAVASGGGHWIQLRRLRAAFEGLETAYVSVFEDYGEELAGARYYVVTDITRQNIIRLPIVAARLAFIILKERPTVVITTGALPGLIAIAVARLLGGARTIWIDSIANCERLSSSGRQARYVAHEWLTQWPELSSPDGPGYWGSVI